MVVKKLAIKEERSINNLRSLFIDKQGLVLDMSTPVAGNHNDLFNIENTFEELTTMKEDPNISVDGLFMNTDAGGSSLRFDTERLNAYINYVIKNKLSPI